MDKLIFIAIAYGGLPVVIWALIWSTRRLQHPRTIADCSGCGYSLLGLQGAAKCPECGLERATMHAPASAIEEATQRVAVALLPLSVTLFVATTAAIMTHPSMEISELGMTVAAPYLILAIATWVLHRPSKLRRSLLRALVPTTLCNGVLVYVLCRYDYWAAPIAVSAGELILFSILVIPWALTNAEELLRPEGR